MLFRSSDARSFIGARPALFFLASYLVTLSVYAFNSWAGSSDDAANPRRSKSNAGMIDLRPLFGMMAA